MAVTTTQTHLHQWRSTGKPGPGITQQCLSCKEVRVVPRAKPVGEQRRELLRLDARCAIQQTALENVLGARDLEAAKAAAAEGLRTGGRKAA